MSNLIKLIIYSIITYMLIYFGSYLYTDEKGFVPAIACFIASYIMGIVIAVTSGDAIRSQQHFTGGLGFLISIGIMLGVSMMLAKKHFKLAP